MTSAPRVYATVNGQPIEYNMIEQAYRERETQAAAEGVPAPAKQDFFQAYIDGTLLLQYAKKNGLDKDPAYLEKLDELQRQLLVEHALQRQISENVTVTDQEIEQYYNDHPAEFATPEKIQVRHILVATREEAEAALVRIRAGESFHDVAEEVSIHASRRLGGVLPPFARGANNPAFEEAAFALKVGELSSIVKTDLGYHIIEKTAEIPAKRRTLDEVRSEIVVKLLADKRAHARENFLGQLRAGSQIEVLTTP
ncbi:MAG: peptidyl-prolyl cis-trans isomerase [bacterium]